MTEDESKILSEAPDYDNQLKILEEEHDYEKKKRNWYILMACILVFVVAIFAISYSFIHVYRPYSPGKHKNNCDNVNIKVNNSKVPNINISTGKDCKPEYNIDYYNNRKPTFNIDLYGDKSVIFNKTNQMDASGKYCVLNCDKDNDGWPDYNIDLDGDGKADINIASNPQKSTKCDTNCDINYDTAPDTNVVVGDKKVNRTDENHPEKPLYDITYKGNNTPTFNVDVNGDGTVIKNKVNQMDETGKKCLYNCDIDDDGWPDYNIKLDENGPVLNELISSEDGNVPYPNSKNTDWKCNIDKEKYDCDYKDTNVNKYINIDIDGDGKADVNISNDGGKTLQNEINKEGQDGKKLNVDSNLDGFPDYNIDLDNDGKADINIVDKDNKCIKNCDFNGDGKPDYLVEINKEKEHLIHIGNLNIDIDYDGICDVNCDLDGDLYPDTNIDVDGDTMPDINIDYNNDGKADFNIDTNNDGKPDRNIDAYGTGSCNFNCIENGNIVNPVGTGSTCTKNCDTDNDGLPDKNVYIDKTSKECDFNCSAGAPKEDKDNNYYLDNEYKDYTSSLDIESSDKSDFYINNPLDILTYNIEPGWDGKYVLTVTNNSNFAVSYRVLWTDVTNEFTDANNLDYNLTRNGINYIAGQKAPKNSIILKDNEIIKAKISIKYVLDIKFTETGVLQNIDSGKNFHGKLTIEPIK